MKSSPEYLRNCIGDISSQVTYGVAYQFRLPVRYVPQRLCPASKRIACDLEKQEHQSSHEFERAEHRFGV